MRVRSVLGLLVALGCNTPGSIELDIPPSSQAIGRVQLFVGVGDSTIDGIAPAGANGRVDATSWDRDANNELSHATAIPGQQISFGLEGPASPLSIVIAVGFDMGGHPIAAGVIPENLRPLDVPDHSIARYTLPLEPLASVDSTSKLEARVWKANETAPECVLVNDKAAGDISAIITPGDQDCDGWPSGTSTECVKSWFNATRSPRLDGMNCLLPTSFATPSGAVGSAVLGGDTCVDGTGTVHGCAVSNYCLPRTVNELCAGSYSCAQDVTTRNTTVTVTHMQCYVPNDGNGNLCEIPLAGFNMPAQWLPNRTCATGSIKISRPGQQWGTEVNATIDGGTITTTLLQSDTTDCQFTVTPKGPAPTSNIITWGALVAGDLDNGRGIAIPYVFTAEPTNVGCDKAIPCLAIVSTAGMAADGLGACIASPALEP